MARTFDQPINDRRFRETYTRHSDLVTRLQADTCELCGSHENIEVHHIRKLADLKKPGRKDKPMWMKRMIALRRKTLVVCKKCHSTIHAGKSALNPTHISSGEPDDAKVSRPVRRGVYGKVPSK